MPREFGTSESYIGAMMDLFAQLAADIVLASGAMLLAGFARREDDLLLGAVRDVATHALFRHMVTPGGWPMSMAMTNCGQLGWVTDRTGYRYDSTDPDSGAL